MKIENEEFICGTSWGSIFAGMVIVMITQLTLSLLGLAIGFLNVNPQTGYFPIKGLTLGAIMWWISSSLMAVYLGSRVSARLAGVTSVARAQLHGILTWAVSILAGIFIFTGGIGLVASGAMGVVTGGVKTFGGIAGAAGISAAGVMAKDPGMLSRMFPELNNQLQKIDLRIKASDNPEQAKQEIVNAAMNLIKKGPYQINEADKNNLSSIIVKYTDMTPQEARSSIDQFITQAQNAEEQLRQGIEKSKEIANQALKTISAAAFASFIMLLLTFFVALLGGAHGAVLLLPHEH